MKIRRFLLALLLIGIGFISFPIWDQISSKKAEIPEQIVQQKIETIAELATISYQYQAILRLDKPLLIGKLKLPFTEKHFLATYDGEIKLGVKVGNPEIESIEDKIRITLPHAQILSHTSYEDSLTVYDQSKNIFNPIEVEDFNQVIGSKKKEMEEKVISAGLLDRSEAQVKQMIISTLDEFGYHQVIVQFQ